MGQSVIKVSVFNCFLNLYIKNPNYFAGKWSLSIGEWPWSSFPSYFFGPSTLITGQAVRPLLDAAKVSPYFWIDDIYLSGILAEKAGVSLHRCSDTSEYVYVKMLILYYTYILHKIY